MGGGGGGDDDREAVATLDPLRDRNLNSRLGFFLLAPAFSGGTDSSDGGWWRDPSPAKMSSGWGELDVAVSSGSWVLMQLE